MTPNTEMWESIKEFAMKVVQTIKKCFKIFVSAVKKLFVSYCLHNEGLRQKALIYVRTKNKRIKQKQFKWLIKAFEGLAS